MSTSLLYHTWKLRGIVYCATRYENGATHFCVSLHRDIPRCSACVAARHASPTCLLPIPRSDTPADLVLDHFHVIKWFNEKLTRLRRSLYKEADEMGKKTLKGVRWLLLKNPENLRARDKPEKDERRRLQDALALNEPLMKAYYMKEALRQLWKQTDKQETERVLDQWCATAESSGVKILQDAAKQLRRWKFALLNWYNHPISTGPLESMNNKIGALQRRAYGYRDKEYFHLRIKHLHQCTYALTG